MKITLHRYLFREISGPFLLGLLVFTGILVMENLLRITELVLGSGVPAGDVGRILLYLLPSFCTVTIPMAFLLSVLLAFGRLSSDSEITAMKASGVSLYSLFPPVVAWALLAGCATAFMTVSALPWGQKAYRALVREIVEAKTTLTPREGIFSDQFPGIVLYVNRYHADSGEMEGVMIHDEREGEQPVTIFAERGSVSREHGRKIMRLHLTGGSMHRAAGAAAAYRLLAFDSYDLMLNLERPPEKARLDETSLSLPELAASLAAAPQGKAKNTLLVEYHRRFSLPFACLVFALCGVPLGLQNQRSGRSGGFSLSILILLLYYIVLSAAMSLGQKGSVPAPLATWSPNILFLLLGLYLMRMAAAERPVPFLEAVSTLPHRIALFLRRRRR